ncbi:MAG: hypothetical protein H6807_05815 [Planctomycetes bacterium]|nr:hypothetical protein [Planctomycetota bacterium]
MNRRPGRAGGMTILELLVVMTIIALMSAVTVGMIRRGDTTLTVEVNGRLVRSILRQARNSALSTGGGVMVRLDPERSIIEASPMELGGNWHFEDETGARRTTVPGSLELVEEGKMGRALKLGGGAVDLGQSVQFGGDQGLRVQLWVKAERLTDGHLLTRENGYRLSLTETGAIRAELPVGEQKDRISLETRDGLLRPGRWTRVAFGYDRIELAIEVDGVLQAFRPESRPIFEDGKPPQLSLGGGFEGLIDEVRVDVARSGVVEEIARSCDIGPGCDLIVRFDGKGRLDRRFHKQPVRIVLSGEAPEDGEEGAGKRIEEVIKVEFSGAIR